MRDDETPDGRYDPGPLPGRSDDATSTGPHPDQDDLAPPPRPRSRTRSARLRLVGTGARLAGRFATPDGRRRVRVVLAGGVVCCLGLATFAQAREETAHVVARVDPLAARSELVQRAQADQADRSEAERASRARERQPAPGPESTPTGTPGTRPAPAGAVGRSTTAAVPDPDTAPAPTAPARRPAPVDPGPVAGLTAAQMDNAKAIVRTGRDLGVPRRGLVIAVATAMQESNLYNVASGVLPESQNHPHQGIGWDHDSVGLFQQRSSTGWGPVARLMDPAYATTQFLNALRQVPGWERMRLTEAAQAVQVSAYPEHYAKHESRATRVVDAIVPGWR